MSKLIIVTRDGQQSIVEGTVGMSVMENIRQSGIEELLALCGGCQSCATCHVYVDTAFASKLPTILGEESDMLDGSGFRRPNSRLACQIKFGDELDGLKVTIAPED